MRRLIYTYALIKSLYDEGEDYLDSFWPFAVRVMAPNELSDCAAVQNRLKADFHLEIPLHVLRTILHRAKRRGLVEQERKSYRLTQHGVGYLDKLETEKEAERRVNALLQDIRGFLEQAGAPLSAEEIYGLLIRFLHKDIDFLIHCVNPAAALMPPETPGLEPRDTVLMEYMRHAEQEQPHNYATLEDLVRGSVISVVLYSKDPSDIATMGRKKFKGCTAYLDSNFLFSLLGFHSPEVCAAAQELMPLLRNARFDLRVFSFTLEEICRVIRRYPTELNYYPISIAVDSIYSQLKRRGWRATDAREFIISAEEVLRDKGVGIEWVKDVDLEAHDGTSQELQSLLSEYKPLQGVFSRNHDLMAIERVRQIRGKPIRRIENAKAVFLTSDVRLSRFKFTEMRHKQNGTICEAVLVPPHS